MGKGLHERREGVRYEVTVDNGKDKDLLLEPLSERPPRAFDPQLRTLPLALFGSKKKASCTAGRVNAQANDGEFVSTKIKK